MFNPLKYFRNNKVGLVLGSGGAKGLAHISVIKYLKSMDIPVDIIVGSSIGAVIGASYACGTLDILKKDLLSVTRKELFSLFDITIPRSGLVKGDKFISFLEKYIPVDTKIEDLPLSLSIVATDYYSGKSVIFRKGLVLEALRASISIPGVFIPVSYKNTFLIDGGVANPLPVDIAKMMGADFTIAVNLHPGLKTSRLERFFKSRIDRRKLNLYSDDLYFIDNQKDVEIPEKIEEGNSNGDSWFSSIEQWFGIKRKVGVDFPNIFEILFQSIDIMEIVNTQNILRQHKPTVLIEPNVLNTGTLDFEKAYETINEGYKACAVNKNRLNRKIKFWV